MACYQHIQVCTVNICVKSQRKLCIECDKQIEKKKLMLVLSVATFSRI